MNWKFEIIRPNNGVWNDALVKEWRQLSENVDRNHVFFHPALVDAWLATYQLIRNLEPFFVRATNGDAVAMMPMVLWHKNWKNAFQNVIVPVGYSDFDYHDPLLNHSLSLKETSEYWNGLLDCLKQNFTADLITIDGITDPMIDQSRQWQQGEICPILHLDNIKSDVDLMAFFKTSLRGDIRRQIRRLEEIGPLYFQDNTSWDDIPANTFANFMEQHARRWPNAYKAPRFHENLLRYGLKAGVVHFSTLAVGDTEIAWHLGFTHNRRYYYYMPAGNQEFFRFSPTKIHLFYLVRRAVEQGYRVYDHLRGEENYKSGWSNDSQFVNSLQIESSSVEAKIKRSILKLR